MEDFERNKKRDFERKARASMAQKKHTEPVPLFGEPVRSSHSDSDRCIQLKLGDFSLVKQIFDEESDEILIGIQTRIPSPAASRQPMMQGLTVQNNRDPAYPFHQPPPYNNRDVFVKPDDSKPTYMSNQKHLPPPIPQQMHNGSGKTIEKQNIHQLNGRPPTLAKSTKVAPDKHPSSSTLPNLASVPDVEKILQIMTSKIDLLPSIAPTPRNELTEIQLTRQPIYADMLAPIPSIPQIIQKYSNNEMGQPNPEELWQDLLNDLDVSDSDDGGSVSAAVVENSNNDRTKEPALIEHPSSNNDNSSERGTETTSQESSSKESKSGAAPKVEDNQEKNKWYTGDIVQISKNPIKDLYQQQQQQQQQQLITNKTPRRRPHKKQQPVNDEDGFSSAAAANRSSSVVESGTSRLQSIDKEKKRRGRPRKDPLATAAPPKSAPNKKETRKKANARKHNGRSNSKVKSREMLSTDSSSAEEDTPAKEYVRLPIISEEAQTQQVKENQMPSDELLSPIACKPTNAEIIEQPPPYNNRDVFVKPDDSKPTYMSNQKHLPPPIPQQMHNGSGRTNEKQNIHQLNGRPPTLAKSTKVAPDKHPSSSTLPNLASVPDVEKILQIMTSKTDLLPSIVPTPRNDLTEIQLTRQPIYADMLAPIPSIPQIIQKYSNNEMGQPNPEELWQDLLNDLDVSDSDDGGSVSAAVVENSNNDRTKEPALKEHPSPNNDNSSERGTETTSQESSSQESKSGAAPKVEDNQEKNKWYTGDIVQISKNPINDLYPQQQLQQQQQKLITNKAPRRRPRKKQQPVNDEDGFSITAAANRSSSVVESGTSRFQSIDKEKKRRGRPSKDPLATAAPPKSAPNKKETRKKANTRKHNGRSNSKVKSREILSTTDSSSAEEDTQHTQQNVNKTQTTIAKSTELTSSINSNNNNEYKSMETPSIMCLTSEFSNRKLTNSAGSTIKRENIKTESNIDPEESQSSHKPCTNDFAPHSRRKRSSSGSNSPYKRKKRNDLVVMQITPANRQRFEPLLWPPLQKSPIIQKVYSYFECTNDKNNEIKDYSTFLSKAKRLKHAADTEKDLLAQAMLYLEAALYYLLTGTTLERDPCTVKTAFTMFKDTLRLIEYISLKYKNQQQFSTVQGNTHRKVAIFSLRCQSLIHLKLYNMQRAEVKDCNKIISEYMTKRNIQVPNDDTPSPISPSNSLGSQSSGSNTPPCSLVPLQVHRAFQQQGNLFNNLVSCHDLWDQADALVTKGNHTDFFITLDHENGPITLHSTIDNAVKYTQAGLQQLKLEIAKPL